MIGVVTTPVKEWSPRLRTACYKEMNEWRRGSSTSTH